jgi:hypothetical protein
MNPAFLAVFLGILLMVSPAASQDAPAKHLLTIELNKLEPTDTACRINFVVRNETQAPFTEVLTELVFFDKESVIMARQTLDLGHLKPNKTLVLAFPVAAVKCEQLGKVLLNKIVRCGHPSDKNADCTDGASVTFKGDVPFFK